jgi:CheY-like chemotaxis protein
MHARAGLAPRRAVFRRVWPAHAARCGRHATWKEVGPDDMAHRGGRPLVLLVEDNPDEREIYTHCLNLAGFEVVSATNGIEAVEQVQSTRPDVIVTDMAMPLMDGATAIKHIRRDPAFMHVPIVAMTGYSYSAHKPLSSDVGADAFVLKPFRPDELVALLGRILG